MVGTVSPRRALVGALVLLACLQYVFAEAIAAHAWQQPAYSYLTNYISDLGVVGCGTPPGEARVCSPLALVMNTGFVLAGVLCIAGTVLLRPLLPAPWLRRTVMVLATIHGLGSILVGLVHSAPGTIGGSPRLHIVGAYLAILGGNTAVIAAGIAVRRAGAPAWLGLMGIGLGLLGLASGVALVFSRVLPPGVIERMAADTMTVWEVLTGATLLAAMISVRPTGSRLAIRDLRRRDGSRAV